VPYQGLCYKFSYVSPCAIPTATDSLPLPALPPQLASLPALHTLSLLETRYDSRAAAGALAHVSSVLYARLPGWWMAAGPEVPAAAQVAVAAGGP
jgi:hypothetical protein